jgi:serine phosphatase RsbU (regulator of sigma subunit)
MIERATGSFGAGGKPLVSGATLSNGMSLAIGALALVGLYVTSFDSYLLFHSAAELVFMLVAFAVFVMAWNLRPFLDDDYPLFLGISLATVGTLRLIHMLDYRGMGVFHTVDANHATQLWIACGYLAAVSLLVAPIFIGRRMNVAVVGGAYAAVAAAILTVIYVAPVFPRAYETGVGLTPFKKVSEYVICVIMLCAAGALWRRRRSLTRATWHLMEAAILVWIVSELCFTLYVGVYTTPNLIGHLLSVLSALLVYQAVVHAEVAEPHALAVESLRASDRAQREAAQLHQRLEASLLPSLPLEHPGLRFYTRYEPGEERLFLGGDFIDLAQIDAQRVGVLVGDVSGHGPDAAALGATLRAGWQALTTAGVGFSQTIETLGRVLEREAPSADTFVTCVLAVVDEEIGELHVLCLGHPAPLIIADGQATSVEVTSHPPLGLADHSLCDATVVTLPSAASLLFFTDGVIEGRTTPGASERLGIERFAGIISHECVVACDEAALDRVLATVVEMNGGPLADDVAVVMVTPARAGVLA